MIAFAPGVVVPDGVCTKGFFLTQNACSESGNSWLYLSDGLEGAVRLAGMEYGWCCFHVPVMDNSRRDLPVSWGFCSYIGGKPKDFNL